MVSNPIGFPLPKTDLPIKSSYLSCKAKATIINGLDEKIFRHPALLCHRPIGQNMLDGEALFYQIPAEKERPVALFRRPLGAHQGDAVAPYALPEALQPLGELGPLGHQAVVGPAGSAIGLAGRQAAQLAAQEDVGEAGALQGAGQVLLLELGMVAAVELL